MNRSDEIKDLIAALVKAQAEFEPVFKATANPAYHSKYADLQTIISASQPALLKNGIAVLQAVRCNVPDKTTEVETMLCHTSGQWMSDTLSLPATMRERMDAQSVGSSVTYGRRYGLQAMLNIAADVDDDGNAAADIGSKEASQAVAKAKIEAAKKVFISYSPDLTLFVWGPGCMFVEQVLKSSGIKNVLNQWAINRKDAPIVYQALQEAGIEISEEPYGAGPAEIVPAAAPKAEKASPSPRKPSQPSEDGELKGFLLGIKEISKNNKTWLILTIDGAEYSLWDNHMMPSVEGDEDPLFAIVKRSKGLPITAYIKTKGQYKNVAAITRLGDLQWEFSPDGYVPVRQAGLL